MTKTSSVKRLILTPKKRLEIYNSLLLEDNLNRMYFCGICYVLSMEFPDSKLDFRGNGGVIKDVLRNLPELYNYKPVTRNIYWFPLTNYGFRRRKEIIRAAIKDVKTEFNL